MFLQPGADDVDAVGVATSKKFLTLSPTVKEIPIPTLNGNPSDNGLQLHPAAVHSTKPQMGEIRTADLFSLKERLIIVTGGGRGLGAAAVTALLEAGADVVSVGILPEPERNEWDHATSIAQQHSRRVTYVQVDVTDAEALSTVFDSIVERARYPLRGLVTCAGVTDAIPALEYYPADFRRILDVNTTGTFLSAQLAARIFLKQNVIGSIVMIASMSGSIANKGLPCVAYNTSKSAVHQMCRSMAAELSTHPRFPIRINTLSPGYIRTAMTDHLLRTKPNVGNLWIEGAMLNRLAEPEEFRAPLIFLLSDGSSFMTGADLRVDGGYCAW